MLGNTTGEPTKMKLQNRVKFSKIQAMIGDKE